LKDDDSKDGDAAWSAVAGTLSRAQRAAVRALAVDVQHDLGRYVAMQSRWLDDSMSDADRLSAVRTDLLATRCVGDRRESADEVFGRWKLVLMGEEPLAGACAPSLARLLEVVELLAAMAQVEEQVAVMRRPLVSSDEVESAIAAAGHAAAACRAFAQRVLTEVPSDG
jgi:hypothetical protein